MARAREGEGSGFTKRADDNPRALRRRLADYHEKTSPLLTLFEQRNMLLRVDGSGTIEDVYQAIVEGLALDGRAAGLRPEPR